MKNELITEVVSKFNEFEEQEKIELLGILLKQLKSNSIQIPVGIFDNELSSLEAIVKFLKENLNLRFSKIAKLLNRNNKSIWLTYQNAKGKMLSSFQKLRNDITIPASIFADRKLSILENLVNFLKELDLTNHEIALMLNLNDRTIWAVYHKVKIKRGIK